MSGGPGGRAVVPACAMTNQAVVAEDYQGIHGDIVALSSAAWCNAGLGKGGQYLWRMCAWHFGQLASHIPLALSGLYGRKLAKGLTRARLAIGERRWSASGDAEIS